MLGFNASKIERDGSPDPWWSSGDYCLVFEDHAGARPESALSVEKARQVADHPRWIRENVPELRAAKILPVLVTPVTKSSEGALPHLREVAYWSISDFRNWAGKALSILRELRSNYEADNIAWRMEAASRLTREGLDLKSLFSHLDRQRASDAIKV